MLRRARTCVWLLLVASSLSAQGKALVYENPAHGLSLKLPRRFKQLPVEKDRRQVLAHFVATRGYPVRDLPYLYRAAVRILHIPTNAATPTTGVKNADAAASKPSTAELGPHPYPQLTYADYQKYLKANLPGALALQGTKPVQVGDRRGLQVTVSLTAEDRLFRVVAFAVTRDTDRYVVEATYMPIHRKKVEAALLACLRSFRVGDARPDLRRPAPPQPMWQLVPLAWQKLSAKVRAAQRRDHERKLHAWAKATALPGWTVKETKACLIVSDAPPRYIATAAQAVDRCRQFLEDQFDGVNDEWVHRPVLRVFKDNIEYRFYRARARQDHDYVPYVDEVCVVARSHGRQWGQMEKVYAGLFHHYLDSKCNHLHRHLPAWLKQGVGEYLRWSRLEKTGFVFQASDAEKNELRDGRRKDRRQTLAQVMEHKLGEFEEGDDEIRYQRARVVRFLLKRMAEDNGLRSMFADYARATAQLQRRLFVPVPTPGPVFEAPEAVKERKKAEVKTLDALLKAVNAACGWSAARQQELQAAYDKFNARL